MQFNVSLNELNAFAKEFWSHVHDKKVFAFHGEMGAGKTTIITALCRSKGVTDTIGSPTFSIINEYLFLESGRSKKIFHIDLYRLKDNEEVIQAGVEDCVFSGELCVVEWPERAADLFVEDTVHVFIKTVSETTRSVEIKLV
ncbi:MAG: tRNA (adenosine(37)-N6)-threonylcarbamoyltransferase complex ATPase subunit type 1 TsaE [Flavisolibacter sp.]